MKTLLFVCLLLGVGLVQAQSYYSASVSYEAPDSSLAKWFAEYRLDSALVVQYSSEIMVRKNDKIIFAPENSVIYEYTICKTPANLYLCEMTGKINKENIILMWNDE